MEARGLQPRRGYGLCLICREERPVDSVVLQTLLLVLRTKHCLCFYRSYSLLIVENNHGGLWHLLVPYIVLRGVGGGRRGRGTGDVVKLGKHVPPFKMGKLRL